MNSLNAIAACVGEDPARARRLIADLAELLRAAIHSEGHERPVRDEVAWLRRYGALLEARYDGDLVLAWHVDDAAAAEPIPPLLIQPLVENAILHGGDAPAPRRVDVAATVDAQGRLQLEVASDGVAPGTPGTGSGLSLVRRRLALWRPGATLSVVQQDGRTRALVAVPPHRAG
jgi:LytS/YehU family sensor histidine kinase